MEGEREGEKERKGERERGREGEIYGYYCPKLGTC